MPQQTVHTSSKYTQVKKKKKKRLVQFLVQNIIANSVTACKIIKN